MPYRLYTLFCFILISRLLTAQVVVSATLDSTEILIGDQVNLNILVNHDPNLRIKPIDYRKLDELKEVEVVEVQDWDTLSNTGEIIIEQKVVLTSFDSGAYWLPALPVQYMENGRLQTIQTEELPLTVTTIPVASDSIELEDIKPILREPMKLEDYLPYLGGAAALLLLAALLFYFSRNRPTEEAPAVEIILPAHEIALQQLSALKAARLWQQGEVKAYQTQLTYILRQYLENRFGIKALESTTDEILHQLRSIDFDDSWKHKLSDMLQVADLVKFAKAKPPVDFHDRVLEDAVDFVNRTKEQKEEQEL